jgi:hypothetical protein
MMRIDDRHGRIDWRLAVRSQPILADLKEDFFSISVSPILTFIALPSAVSSRIIGALDSIFASQASDPAGSECQIHH